MDHRIAVLVVEDEALIRMAIVGELEDAGFDVFEAAHADAASHSRCQPEYQADVHRHRYAGRHGRIETRSGRSRSLAADQDHRHSGHQTIDTSALPIEGLFMRKPYNTKRVVQSINEMVLG
jgi:DNA-binding NtrC family response regulator